jgi:hypothetical protein
MYAVAANCPELEVLTLGGYNEHVTDGGITVLLEACRRLNTVKLSSKLLKVRHITGLLGQHAEVFTGELVCWEPRHVLCQGQQAGMKAPALALAPAACAQLSLC